MGRHRGGGARAGQGRRHQRQHVGDTADSCIDTEDYFLLRELNQEGPRREEDMFKAVGGVLLFSAGGE